VIAIRPEVTDFLTGSSWDYSFVPEMCPSGNVVALTDSDEYLVVEMQPRDHEARHLRWGALRPATARKAAHVSLRAIADQYAANVMPVIREIQRAGATSLHDIAAALNARGIATPRGGKWYATSVRNVLARAYEAEKKLSK